MTEVLKKRVALSNIYFGKERMKVALIDNMNNNFFALCRYLRDRGVDAHLFVIPGMHEHFMPQNDTFEDISKVDFIHDFPFSNKWTSWLASGWGIGVSLSSIEGYDVIIACGPSIAILKRKNINVDIFIPYGKDLYDLPFGEKKSTILEMVFEFKINKVIIALVTNLISKYQNNGIVSSQYIVSNRSVSIYNEALLKLGRDSLGVGIPIVYNRSSCEKKSSRWGFLSACDFVVFNHSRHVWATNGDKLSDFKDHGGIKRNDKVIRAFCRFIKTTNYKNPKLVLFDYGVDVAASKALIEDLGITNVVRWMPKMSRKFVVQGLRRASLACDQFRYGFVGTGGASIEAMAQGVPLVRNMGDVLQDEESKYYNAPIVNALEEDDILDVFVDYENDPQKYRDIGDAGLKWFNQHLGEGLVDVYVKLIEDVYSQKVSS